MDRSEAIRAVVNAWDQIDSEFGVGERDHQEGEQECHDVLTALGCTPEEMRLLG